MNGPRLTAEALMWRNRRSRIKFTGMLAALLILLVVVAALAAEGQPLAIFVPWLRSHGAACAAFTAFFSAIGIAQRRNLLRAEFPRSWLAAVPVRSATARWEAFLMETLPAGVAVATLCLLAALAALVLSFTTSVNLGAIFVVWAYLAAGVACGAALSFLIPRPKPVDLPPGSRYVPKGKIHRAAAIRPSLSALGRWPIRQMFAWAQPKVVSRGLIPVLVMMPLGTKADDAMIAIALFGTLFAMTLLSSAVMSVSRSAQRWLAPLPVRRAAIIRAFLLPAWGVIAAAGVTAALLLLVFNVSYRVSATAGTAAAIAGCAVIAVALLWNTRSAARAR
jgi:hypothetical protein